MEQIHSFHSDGYVGSSSAVSSHCNFNTLRQSRSRKQDITTVHRKVLGIHTEIIILASHPHQSYPGKTYQKKPKKPDVSLVYSASLNPAWITGL